MSMANTGRFMDLADLDALGIEDMEEQDIVSLLRKYGSIPKPDPSLGIDDGTPQGPGPMLPAFQEHQGFGYEDMLEASGMPRPQSVPRQIGPTKGQRIGGGIMDAIRAGMVGASTPGTGNLGADVARAGTAALRDKDQRDLAKFQQQVFGQRERDRQEDREKDNETAERRARAYEEVSRARAEDFRARTKKASEPKPTSPKDSLVNVGGALYDVTTGRWLQPPKTTPTRTTNPPRPIHVPRGGTPEVPLTDPKGENEWVQDAEKVMVDGEWVVRNVGKPYWAASRKRAPRRPPAPTKVTAADKNADINNATEAYIGRLTAANRSKTPQQLIELVRADDTLNGKDQIRARAEKILRSQIRGTGQDAFGGTGGTETKKEPTPAPTTTSQPVVVKWGKDSNGRPVRLSGRQ